MPRITLKHKKIVEAIQAQTQTPHSATKSNAKPSAKDKEIRASAWVPKGKKVSLLIDGSNLFVRNASIPRLQELSNPAGQKAGALYGSLKSVIREMRVWCPFEVFFVLDKSRSRRRKQLYPDYKANRGHGLVSGSSEHTLEDRIEQESRMRQLSVLEKLLPYMGVRPVWIEGFEADDIIAGLVDFNKRYPDIVSVVCSMDTDFVQLHDGFSCIVYSPIKRRIVSAEEYGVTGIPYALAKSVSGDLATDNIPGVPRIGMKTMAKLFSETFIPTTLEELKKVAEQKKEKSYGQAILDNWPTVERNYQLISLDVEVTKIPSTLMLTMKEWKNHPLTVSPVHIAKYLREEGIDPRLLSEIMSVVGCVSKG
jgi:5'-3' exonuclease